jgi:hypothetical protein
MSRLPQTPKGNKKPHPAGWKGVNAPSSSPLGGGGPGHFKQAGSLSHHTVLAQTGSTLPHHQSPVGKNQAGKPTPAPTQVKVVVEHTGGLFTVTMEGSTAMRPFLRSTDQPFEDTVTGFAKHSHLDVVINGNMYDVSKSGIFGSFFGSISAKDTKPLGHVQGQGKLLGGENEHQMFYVAWQDGGNPAYSFGFGDPPAKNLSQ